MEGAGTEIIFHSPQSLITVNVEPSHSCTVKAKIQAQNRVTTALPVSVCACSPGENARQVDFMKCVQQSCFTFVFSLVLEHVH